MHPTVGVGPQAVPLGQQVESRHGEGKPRPKVDPDTMSHMLDVADGMQHRKHSFNQTSELRARNLPYDALSVLTMAELQAPAWC